ncbi:hypothetical protein [Streptomyces sp. NPDC058308]|uniref:hypothetical protein n=1 Tax=Streptomyces sp. NPDC058308 TaxID=3346440 RepID=UPI0036EA160B
MTKRQQKINKKRSPYSPQNLKRVARQTGVRRVSAGAFSEATAMGKEYFSAVLHYATVYAQHARRRTVLATDVQHAQEALSAGRDDSGPEKG